MICKVRESIIIIMDSPSVREIFLAFLRIGATAFGGAYSILVFFEKEFVGKRLWLSREDLADGIAIGQITPGAPAINTGIFIGYKLKKISGAIAAAAGLVIPGLIIIIILAYSYVQYHDLKIIRAALKAVSASVAGLILSAALGMGKTSITNYKDLALGISAFVCILLFKINPIILLVLSGAIGILIYRKYRP